jgi:hypothetical protein
MDARIAAPGPHDFAVRAAFSSGEDHLTPQRPIASHAQRIVTIAKRPSGGLGTGFQ